MNICLLDIKQDVNILEIAALINPNVDSANKNSDGLCGPRRSTRKRKERYCYGPILGKETMSIQKSQNLAALRLHILEKKPDFELNQLLFLCLLLERTELKEDISSNILSNYYLNETKERYQMQLKELSANYQSAKKNILKFMINVIYVFLDQ